MQIEIQEEVLEDIPDESAEVIAQEISKVVTPVVKEKKKGPNYFDEETTKAMLLELQRTATIEERMKPNGKMEKIIHQKDKALEHKITLEVLKVVKAVIQVYRYYIFEPYDDCLQHGIMSCAQNYFNFSPANGTAFNYFSIISKRSLLNYTDRRKKHRNHNNIDDFSHVNAKSSFNFDFFIEELEYTLIDIIDSNYIAKKRKLYLKISSVLVDYLHKTKKYVGKSDFYSWCRSYGIRSVDVREFVAEINKHNVDLYHGIQQVEEHCSHETGEFDE